jgi:hypothetical protein
LSSAPASTTFKDADGKEWVLPFPAPRFTLYSFEASPTLIRSRNTPLREIYLTGDAAIPPKPGETLQVRGFSNINNGVRQLVNLITRLCSCSVTAGVKHLGLDSSRFIIEAGGLQVDSVW